MTKVVGFLQDKPPFRAGTIAHVPDAVPVVRLTQPGDDWAATGAAVGLAKSTPMVNLTPVPYCRMRGVPFFDQPYAPVRPVPCPDCVGKGRITTCSTCHGTERVMAWR